MSSAELHGLQEYTDWVCRSKFHRLGLEMAKLLSISYQALSPVEKPWFIIP